MTASASGKTLTPSQEDYLEAILQLVRRRRVARVRDIARRLDVGMSSVTSALKSLSKRGFVNYDPYRVITLTDRGRRAAEEIVRRHELLREFLISVLGLDGEAAEANACRMEHAVDAALLERLGRFVEFVRRCGRAGDDWGERFLAFCGEAQDADGREGCVAGAPEGLRKPARQGPAGPNQAEEPAR